MRALIIILLAVLALAAAVPNLPNDFHALASVTESRHGSHKIKFDGRIFEDYSHVRSRIDANVVHEERFHLEVLRLYATQTEYFIKSEDHKSHNCTSQELNGTMTPAFSWVSGAHQSHECHHKREHTGPGVLWVRTNKNYKAMLCVNSQDEADPLWVEFEDIQHDSYRRIDFVKFTPGTPDARLFVVPSYCS